MGQEALLAPTIFFSGLPHPKVHKADYFKIKMFQNGEGGERSRSRWVNLRAATPKKQTKNCGL
jgi:hypothetical protein